MNQTPRRRSTRALRSLFVVVLAAMIVVPPSAPDLEACHSLSCQAPFAPRGFVSVESTGLGAVSPLHVKVRQDDHEETLRTLTLTIPGAWTINLDSPRHGAVVGSGRLIFAKGLNRDRFVYRFAIYDHSDGHLGSWHWFAAIGTSSVEIHIEDFGSVVRLTASLPSDLLTLARAEDGSLLLLELELNPFVEGQLFVANAQTPGWHDFQVSFSSASRSAWQTAQIWIG